MRPALTLARMLPSGEVRRHTLPMTLKEARKAMYHVLVDNRACTASEAQQASVKLEFVRGQFPEITQCAGYSFWLEQN
jgi:hypothetical protein